MTRAISGHTLADSADSAHQIGHVTETISGHALAFPADSANKMGHVTEAISGHTLADTANSAHKNKSRDRGDTRSHACRPS